MRVARIVSHLAVVLGLAGLAGCVLFAAPFEAGAHCEIEGTSACATCLRAQCRPSIDAVCDGQLANEEYLEPQREALEELDKCSAGDADACKTAVEATDFDPAVGQCLLTFCSLACVGATSDAGDD